MTVGEFELCLLAAKAMDWMQPVLNDSPPCFHVSPDGRFCGRAERWAGHEDLHKFKSFDQLLTSVRELGRIEGMKSAVKIIAAQNPSARSPNAEIRGICQREIRKAIG